MPSAPALNLSEMGMSTRASTGVTSFGSKYWVFPEDRDLAARLAQCDLQNGFRRVVVDPTTGFVSLMAPTSSHETHAEAVRKVIEALLDSLHIAYASMAATRWRHPGEAVNTGPEGDACRAQKLHPGPNCPLIDLVQPTENRVRRGRVFSGTCGGLHHVYHWAA